MPEASIFSLPFLIVCATLCIGTVIGWSNRYALWGLPAVAVLGTVSVWYVVDPLYNDYQMYHEQFGNVIIENAWWQVCLFAVVFLGLCPLMTKWIAGHGGKSHAMELLDSRPLDRPWFQAQVDTLFRAAAIVWILFNIVALVRVNFDLAGWFAPYLGHHANPWSRGRIGGGIDAILALAGYFQIFQTAAFGVIFAIAKNPRTRWLAFLICCLSFPYFIFDRTRNTMLAVAVPGFLAWVFGRARGALPVKIGWIVAGVLLTSFWFSFVLGNRTGGSIASAFTRAESFEVAAKTKHLGLNMFEELCWINYFIEDGTYQPNNGSRYFAEIVNPVPRSLWPEKPMIGIDYAIARGQSGGNDGSAGVFATISTGMIGQGIVNFGTFFGPIAAAILMALWVGLLALQDRLGHNPARLLMYSLGIILTFNLGRDITLITLYPFFFGLAMIIFWEKRQQK